MNPKDQKFDPLEQDLPAGLRWSIPDREVSAMELAAWAESPTEEADVVEAALVADHDLRRTMVAIRMGELSTTDEVDQRLSFRLGELMPASPPVLARIGGWVAAAAAAILLAIGGWQLGVASGESRSLEPDTLAIATFGLNNNSVEQDDVLMLVDYREPGE
ncbi:MAG: hypothetical protein P8I91_09675 [Phycisphaerales bacterium]|nr:hypothetical protein [Phycisphaerales bacterium]